MGPNAHCKHIRALLHALLECVCGRSTCLELTCTESLQTFHHPKQRHQGSPVKAQSLCVGNITNSNIIFDPTPVAFAETVEQLNSRVRNETVNYAAHSHCSVPLLQCISPANIYSINNDHDYFSISLADSFLYDENISPAGLSVFDAVEIEERTRGQASSKEWHMERCKRLQSSHFGRIAKATDRTNFDNLL